MNAFRTSTQDHYTYSNQSAPMNTCYDGQTNSELSYHTSSSISMLQPYSPYAPSLPSYYGPQSPIGVPGPEMHVNLGAISSTRLEQLHQPPPRMQSYCNPPRYLDSARLSSMGNAIEGEVESQESLNEETMLSEPVIPALDGFPKVEEFDQLMKSYVNDLSIKKQDKALINARRARNIRTVLTDPKDTAIESAQFRFWVKKMFKLQPEDSHTPSSRRFICHEGKPVAIREKLFKILTRAHQQCQHGGRDKTSAHVRQIYSWVPKELISRFVKICPTCQGRRGATHLTPPDSRRGSPRLELMRAQQLHKHGYRRNSVYGYSDGPNQQMGYSSGHHELGWQDNSSHVQHYFHSDGSGRASMTPKSIPFNQSGESNSQTSNISQYSPGYMTPHANTRYHGY